jgi:hypothetical protein
VLKGYKYFCCLTGQFSVGTGYGARTRQKRRYTPPPIGGIKTIRQLVSLTIAFPPPHYVV